MVKHSTIAIIPARGGSKRIPKKNIVDLCGKPLIAWTIEAAIQSREFTNIIVNTDDREIADIALRYGADVPFLREEHSDDHSTVSEAIVSFLKVLESRYSITEENVCMLMANCPIRSSLDIKTSLREFTNNNRKFQISCFPYGFMNPWWAHTIDRNGIPTAVFPEKIKLRSQDLPKVYCPSGAIWIADREELKSQLTFYGSPHHFEPISWRAAIDIDDMDDLEFARIVMKESTHRI